MRAICRSGAWLNPAPVSQKVVIYMKTLAPSPTGGRRFHGFGRGWGRRILAGTVSAAALVMVPAAPGSAAAGDLTLASTSDTGANANDYSYSHDLSADGTRVAFASAATNLDP